jgi:hypothetical protein
LLSPVPVRADAARWSLWQELEATTYYAPFSVVVQWHSLWEMSQKYFGFFLGTLWFGKLI